MSLRFQPGWILAGMNDPDGRRGIWYRLDGDVLELCGGREGDDFFVRLSLSSAQFQELEGLLSTGAWMCKLAGVSLET